jgi:predicted oxidoreductase
LKKNRTEKNGSANDKTKILSRRDFLKAAGLTVGGVAAAGILNACSGASTETETQTKTVTSTVTQPPVTSTATATTTVTATTTATKTVTSTPTGTSTTGTTTGTTTTTPASNVPTTWDYTFDVVVIGAAATGIPAAIRAKDLGASVLIVEANYDIGGHAIVSGGNVPLGGGTSAQTAAGIKDSPDLMYVDLTDWSVVEPNGAQDYRYNDKTVIRAFCDNSVATWDFLKTNGVTFTGPDNSGASATGNSAPRESHTSWPSTKGAGPEGINGANGAGLMRPLEVSARTKGVQFLLNYHMNTIWRQTMYPRPSGNIMGITAAYTPTIMPGQTTPLKSFNSTGNISTTQATVNIKANKAVIIATGGSTGNVNFRRIMDPRLSEEYCGLAGMPYSDQDASGELAGMTVGASLWGTYNQTAEFGSALTKAGSIGCQYGYTNLAWNVNNPIFAKCGASGLRISDYNDVILVRMDGNRFYNEAAGQFTSNNYNSISNYVQWSWTNARDRVWNPANFLNAACAGIPGSTAPGGGPIWAIFDADAVTREKWTVTAPNVDIANGFFYSANTIADLEKAVAANKYQKTAIPAGNLQAAVTRYNSFVDSGTDSDFAKPAPKYKIQTAPFYAAWATPVIHDARCGLRINGKCQVVDMNGNVIPGLYCGGESAGGFSQHGLARCAAQGYIAGTNAVNG